VVDATRARLRPNWACRVQGGALGKNGFHAYMR